MVIILGIISTPDSRLIRDDHYRNERSIHARNRLSRTFDERHLRGVRYVANIFDDRAVAIEKHSARQTIHTSAERIVEERSSSKRAGTLRKSSTTRSSAM